MFHQIFSRPCAIQRHQTGPLAELRLAWLEHCAQRGLSQSTLRLSFAKTSSAFSFNNLGKPDITC